MPHSSPSALITDYGQRVLLRLDGQFFDLTQDKLRNVLGLPVGSGGLGISIDGDEFSFEFPGEERVVEMSARQLQRRLAKRPVAKNNP